MYAQLARSNFGGLDSKARSRGYRRRSLQSGSHFSKYHNQIIPTVTVFNKVPTTIVPTAINPTKKVDKESIPTDIVPLQNRQSTPTPKQKDHTIMPRPSTTVPTPPTATPRPPTVIPPTPAQRGPSAIPTVPAARLRLDCGRRAGSRKHHRRR